MGNRVGTRFAVAVLTGASGFACAANALDDDQQSAYFSLRGHAAAQSGSVRDATNDPFTAVVGARNFFGHHYLDDAPDDFIFGAGAQDNGDNLITSVGTTLATTEIGLGGALKQIIVSAFTNDSSEWLPAGFDPGSQVPLEDLQFDIGGWEASSRIDGVANPIEWQSAGFTVLNAEIVALSSGMLVASNTLRREDYSVGLAGQGVLSDAAGMGIDEVQIVWTITEIPAPGAAALLGISCLWKARRRRFI